MIKVKTFTGERPSTLEQGINNFLADKRYVDMKVTAVVKPAAGFARPDGYQTAMVYVYTVVYED